VLYNIFYYTGLHSYMYSYTTANSRFFVRPCLLRTANVS